MFFILYCQTNWSTEQYIFTKGGSEEAKMCYADIFWSNNSIIAFEAFVQFKETDKGSVDFNREVLKEIHANNTEGCKEPSWQEKRNLDGHSW